MNAYDIAGIAAVAVLLGTIAAYFLFFRVGKQAGSATAQLDAAKTDLKALKDADAIVTKETTNADLQQSLHDGTF